MDETSVSKSGILKDIEEWAAINDEALEAEIERK